MSSVRLDSNTKKKISRVAAIKGMSLSEIHREALNQYCDRELQLPSKSRYDDIIGVGESSGVTDLSKNRKSYLAAIMDEKYKAKQ